jgi:phosphohistidine swiveling domain-containing protein
MLLACHELKKTSLVGQKTFNLKRLQDEGFRVPRFFAVPSSVVKKMITRQGIIKADVMRELLKEIVEKLPVAAYAIRSSALIEDSRKKSLAGQFRTRIQVTKGMLFEAISEVVTQAQTYLEGNVELFSLLIQEYIEPEWSGITFTREPLGGRQMVVEFSPTRGEDVVGGKIKPERVQLYWNGVIPKVALPEFEKAIKDFKFLESLYKYPQDIEWCVKKGVWFFLQTRPITSLTEKLYKQIVFLDRTLPQHDRFFYKKTELTEAAPRPTPCTFDILKKIYGEDGPIQRVYKKYTIEYTPRDFLKIIGNELFCDREEELKTLLPAYSFLASDSLQPKLSSVGKMMGSIKNSSLLHRISLKNYESLFREIRKRLSDVDRATTVDGALTKLLKDYEYIFEVNLLAGLALKRLEFHLKKDTFPVVELLHSGSALFPELAEWTIGYSARGNVGNSLELADESEFVKQDGVSTSHEVTIAWWKKTSAFKKNYIAPFIKDASLYNHLRECSRWLTVKRVSQLRKLLHTLAKRLHFKDPSFIYFSSLEEILNKTSSFEECKQRASLYAKFDAFTMPVILTNIAFGDNSAPQGVSSGKAKGIMVDEEMFLHRTEGEPVILYTKVLSPDLVAYFGRIVAVVSEGGGMLSHLAIVAREKKIPVIVNVQLDSRTLMLGDMVEMDGTLGTIGKIPNPSH